MTGCGCYLSLVLGLRTWPRHSPFDFGILCITTCGAASRRYKRGTGLLELHLLHFSFGFTLLSCSPRHPLLSLFSFLFFLSPPSSSYFPLICRCSMAVVQAQTSENALRSQMLANTQAFHQIKLKMEQLAKLLRETKAENVTLRQNLQEVRPWWKPPCHCFSACVFPFCPVLQGSYSRSGIEGAQSRVATSSTKDPTSSKSRGVGVIGRVLSNEWIRALAFPRAFCRGERL